MKQFKLCSLLSYSMYLHGMRWKRPHRQTDMIKKKNEWELPKAIVEKKYMASTYCIWKTTETPRNLMAHHNEALSDFQSYPIPQIVFNLEGDSKVKNGLQVIKPQLSWYSKLTLIIPLLVLDKMQKFLPRKVVLRCVPSHRSPQTCTEQGEQKVGPPSPHSSHPWGLWFWGGQSRVIHPKWSSYLFVSLIIPLFQGSPGWSLNMFWVSQVTWNRATAGLPNKGNNSIILVMGDQR